MSKLIQMAVFLTLVVAIAGCVTAKPKTAAEKEALYKALCDAVYSNQFDQVKVLLRAGADPNRESTSNYPTLLDMTIETGCADIAEILMKYGARLSAEGPPCISPMGTFAALGNTNILRILLDQGADPNEVRFPGIPVFEAAANGHLDTVKYLISRGANFKTNGCDGGTLLHAAAQGGNTNLAEFLLTKDFAIDAKNNKGETPLFFAAWYGHLDAAIFLITKGANLNVKTDDGRTILYAAAEGGCENLIDLLLAKGKGEDMNAVMGQGSTLLHAAAAGNCLKFAQLLINKGARINAVNNVEKGETPLHAAIGRGNKEMAELLLKNGADVNAGPAYGTPLYKAVLLHKTNIVTLLLAKGTDLAADKGLSLNRAVYSGDDEIVRILTTHGADPTTAGRTWHSDDTLLHEAAWMNHKDIAETLIAKGVEVDSRNERGETPLHKAASNGNKNMVELLISKGADVNAETARGDTPLFYAIRRKHTEIADLLRKHGAVEVSPQAAARTNAIPIDRVRDKDWRTEQTSHRKEKILLQPTNGTPLDVTIEYGEMEIDSHELFTRFLSRTNRLIFAGHNERRFGFKISVSRPSRVFAFVTHPPVITRYGEWTTSDMYPSRQVMGSDTFCYDYSLPDFHRSETFSFAIYVNGFKVRTLDFEMAPRNETADNSNPVIEQLSPDETENRTSCPALVAAIDRRIPDNSIASITSKHKGQLAIERVYWNRNTEASLAMDLGFLNGLDIEDLSILKIPVSDLSPLTNLPLHSASLCELGVTNLAPLAGLALTNLTIGLHTPDFSPVKALPLKSLRLDCAGPNLSELSGMRISSFYADMDFVNTNFAALASLPLTTLELHGHLKDYDLSWLPQMKHLTRLMFDVRQPIDLAVLRNLPLNDIEFSDMWVNDISGLRGMKLTRLSLSRTNVRDLSPLEGMPLTFVDVSYSHVDDLTPLKNAPITELHIAKTGVTNISALAKMPLKILDMKGSWIRDLSPLEGMSLEKLQLGDLAAVTKGLDVVRAMTNIQHLTATVTKPGTVVTIEDWTPTFWKRYDDLMKKK